MELNTEFSKEEIVMEERIFFLIFKRLKRMSSLTDISHSLFLRQGLLWKVIERL